jgi:hypothetical protein
MGEGQEVPAQLGLLSGRGYLEGWLKLHSSSMQQVSVASIRPTCHAEGDQVNFRRASPIHRG